jgi:hypothetical protein
MHSSKPLTHQIHSTLLASILHICNKTKTMTEEFQPSNRQRFEAALRRFDEENGRDPNVELLAGIAHPRELVYAQWLTGWVLKLCPGAPEAIRLAARCQHLCRWMVPRDSYPMNRSGYLQWRAALKQFHTEKAGQILREVGYADDMIARVRTLNLKQGFPEDPEVRLLEDALCLVFLEHQFSGLAGKTAADKMTNALQKTWKKMTPAAQALAASLPYSTHERRLLDEALKPGPSSP